MSAQSNGKANLAGIPREKVVPPAPDDFKPSERLIWCRCWEQPQLTDADVLAAIAKRRGDDRKRIAREV